jgi:hypothetical protein
MNTLHCSIMATLAGLGLAAAAAAVPGAEPSAGPTQTEIRITAVFLAQTHAMQPDQP